MPPDDQQPHPHDIRPSGPLTGPEARRLSQLAAEITGLIACGTCPSMVDVENMARLAVRAGEERGGERGTEEQFTPSPLLLRLTSELTSEEQEFTSKAGQSMANLTIEEFSKLLREQTMGRRLPVMVALQVCGEALLHVVATLIAAAGGMEEEG